MSAPSRAIFLSYASHHGAEVRALFEQLRDWLISLKGPTAPTSAT